MRTFEWFCAIDWSGAKGKRQKGIAVAISHMSGGAPVLVERHMPWSRAEVLAILRDGLPADTLVGMDLGIALPFADCGAYFPGWADSPTDGKALWAMVDRICGGDPDLAAGGFVDHPEIAPYFRRDGGREGDRFHHHDAPDKRGRFRVTEHAQQAMGCKPTSNFNLIGAAQVGKSSLTGMRVLHRLEGAIPVWPIDPLPQAGSVIVEIYTGLAALEAGRTANSSKLRDHSALNDALAVLGSPVPAGTGPIDDHSSDALLTAAWLRKVAGERQRWTPEALTPQIAATEGWTFGAF
ncbi:MAG: hypothetical protein WA948_06930 [Pontixanthobacter sp.]